MNDQINHASDLPLLDGSDDALYCCIEGSGEPDKGSREASDDGESEMAYAVATTVTSL